MTDPISETTTRHPAGASVNGSGRLRADLTIATRTTWIGNPFPVTDPTWEHVDTLGHWHGFTEDGGLLPTLRSDGFVTRCRHPHGDCPGFHVPAYFCRLCGEPIAPPLRPAAAADLPAGIPTVGWWSALVLEPIPYPAGERVQARFFLPDGTALVGIADVERDSTLTGVGDLATRGAAGLTALPFHQVGPA